MTQVFTYSEYAQDYNTKFLQDHDEIPEWFRTFLNGESSVSQNRDDDLEDYLTQTVYVPSIGVSITSSQSIADNMAAPYDLIAFDGIDFQSTNLFDWVPTDPTVITIEDSGIIAITATCRWDTNPTGERDMFIFLNGGVAAQTGASCAGSEALFPWLNCSDQFAFNAGDQITFAPYQNSGAPLNMLIAKISLSYLGKEG